MRKYAKVVSLVLALVIAAQAQQSQRTLTVQRHASHFDAVASDGAKLVEFDTLKRLREYAAEHGYVVVDERPRCNATTKSGGKCRRVVSKAGEHCYQHR